MLSRSARASVLPRRRHLFLQPATLPASRPLSHTTIRRKPQTAWAEATESAHSVLTPPPSSLPTSAYDPLGAIYSEIGNLKSSLFNLLGSSHPSLDTVAKYYFQAEGKHLRPLLVLLMAQATNGLAGQGWEAARLEAAARNVDDALTSRGGVLNDWNPEQMGREGAGSMTFADPFSIPSTPSYTPPPVPPTLTTLDSLRTNDGEPEILPTQRRLASITEMIHVASLLHDDVIDESALRRGEPSAPNAFGNKMSILSGDFLLGRASVALARLGSREVVELLATVIANLVEGEVLQLRATSEPEQAPTPKGFEEYMRKTYLKTASLMAKSARAAVILGGCGGEVGNAGEWVKDVAYGYGRNLGIAFQVRRVWRKAFMLQIGLTSSSSTMRWTTCPRLNRSANRDSARTSRSGSPRRRRCSRGRNTPNSAR